MLGDKEWVTLRGGWREIWEWHVVGEGLSPGLKVSLPCGINLCDSPVCWLGRDGANLCAVSPVGFQWVT